jgi:hypothetical protein
VRESCMCVSHGVLCLCRAEYDELDRERREAEEAFILSSNAKKALQAECKEVCFLHCPPLRALSRPFSLPPSHGAGCVCVCQLQREKEEAEEYQRNTEALVCIYLFSMRRRCAAPTIAPLRVAGNDQDEAGAVASTLGRRAHHSRKPRRR